MASLVCNESYTPVRRGAYRDLLPFEEAFDYRRTQRWFIQNWTLSMYFVAIYLVLVFLGQRYMRSRPAFHLRGPLFVWNLSLAIFSITATSRILPGMLYLLREHGVHYSVCELGPDLHRQAVSVWTVLFIHSKVVELGDTAFVILRKQKLIFLHWYHHVTVLLFVWYSAANLSSTCTWFMTVNFIVHSAMYSYYALKVLGVPVPRVVSMGLTAVQLVQMAAGVFLTAYSARMRATGQRCCVHDEVITGAVIMYVSYLLLFSKFFLQAYVWKSPRGPAAKRLKKVD